MKRWRQRPVALSGSVLGSLLGWLWVASRSWIWPAVGKVTASKHRNAFLCLAARQLVELGNQSASPVAGTPRMWMDGDRQGGWVLATRGQAARRFSQGMSYPARGCYTLARCSKGPK